MGIVVQMLYKMCYTEAMQSIECGGMIVYEVMRECKSDWQDRRRAPGRKKKKEKENYRDEMLESVKWSQIHIVVKIAEVSVSFRIAPCVDAHVQCFIVGRRVCSLFVGDAVVLYGETVDHTRNKTLRLPRIGEAAEVLLDAVGEGRAGSDVASGSFSLDINSRGSRQRRTIATQWTVRRVHVAIGDRLRDPVFRRVVIVEVQLGGQADV